jgi:hypothetical protein
MVSRKTNVSSNAKNKYADPDEQHDEPDCPEHVYLPRLPGVAFGFPFLSMPIARRQFYHETDANDKPVFAGCGCQPARPASRGVLRQAGRWQIRKLDEGWPENGAPRSTTPLAWPVIDVVER